MKITIYELLGMIKDDKAPKKIKYLDKIFNYNKLRADYLLIENKENEANREYLTDWIGLSKDGLNDEVEIIEEPQEHKIPEKLDIVLLDQSDNWTRKYNKNLKNFENAHIELNPYVIDVIRQDILEFQSKINEIIDYLEKIE